MTNGIITNLPQQDCQVEKGLKTLRGVNDLYNSLGKEVG